jgi:hypothetical protein
MRTDTFSIEDQKYSDMLKEIDVNRSFRSGKTRKNKQALMIKKHKAVAKRRRRRFLFGS